MSKEKKKEKKEKGDKKVDPRLEVVVFLCFYSRLITEY